MYVKILAARISIPLTLILIFYSTGSIAQNKQTWIWHIGNKKLDFHTNPPTITDVAAPFLGTSYSMALADSLGNYQLFISYQTQSLYNSLNQVVKGSGGLSTSNNGILFIPQPANANLIYLVSGSSYALINTRLDSIVAKNIDWDTNADLETFYAEQHTNCSDVWLIGQHPEGFYSYLVSKNGISKTPVFSSLAHQIPRRGSFSSSGRYYAMTSGQNATNSIYTDSVIINFGSFDRTTGVLSNTSTFTYLNYWEIFSTAFSLDETKLYLYMACKNPLAYQLVQVNIINSTPDFSHAQVVYQETYVGGSLHQSSMQLGPDGRIYHTIVVSSRKINIIQNPNVLGVNCNYQDNAIPLSVTSSTCPMFIDTWFSKTCFCLDFVVNNNCETASSTFSVINAENPQTISWDFGDGQTSTALAPTHNYVATGTYTVTLNITTSNGQQQQISKAISVYAQPTKPTVIIGTNK